MIKSFFLTLAVSFFTVSLFAQSNGAVLTFKQTSHDFGSVKKSVPATYSFEFTNTGKLPLMIQDVTASCGCTTPEWPKRPVMPGQSSNIKVSYDASSTGPFNKSVYIKSNASNVQKGERYELIIKGTVK